MPNTISGYRPQQTIARINVAKTAPRISEKSAFIKLNEVESGNDEIDELDSDERHDDPAKAVDEQVALENRERAHRFVGHAAQGQRNQRDDDERVKDDGAKNGASGAVEVHDVEWSDGRER